jgi:chemotaxis protein methyltransferase CheR
MSVETDFGTERMLEPREFDWLRQFLFDRTGIELRPGKESMVMGRLDRRLRHHGLSSYRQYIDMLAGGNVAEVQMAVDLLTTNETYFFREPQHFDFLKKVLETRKTPGQPIRIWSAASSSGEEAYTIAMVAAGALPSGQSWEIVGTDISTRVVETARRGMYPVEAADKIPQAYLKQHCLRGRDDYEGLLAIEGSLKSHVSFRAANLTDLPPDLGVFDIVFLRNVMIYFGVETKQKLVKEIVGMLRPGGYFMVSHSETLNGMTDGLELVQPSVYRRLDSDA